MNRDIDLRFTRHPVTGDVAVKTGRAALLQSVRNLVLTASGDWKAEQGIGAGAARVLGENDIDVLRGVNLEREIRYQIETFEPRVELKKVQTISEVGKHRIRVIILFVEVNQTEVITYDDYIDVLI